MIGDGPLTKINRRAGLRVGNIKIATFSPSGAPTVFHNKIAASIHRWIILISHDKDSMATLIGAIHVFIYSASV